MIRGINSNRYITAEYINFEIHISDYRVDDRSIETLLKHIIFVVDDLRAKMLIDINILTSENIDLIIFTRSNYIESYDTLFSLIVTLLTRLLIKQDVLLNKFITISTYAQLNISVEYISLPDEDNFMFEPIKDCFVTLFAIIVNSSFHIVLARNKLDQSIYLSRNL